MQPNVPFIIKPKNEKKSPECCNKPLYCVASIETRIFVWLYVPFFALCVLTCNNVRRRRSPYIIVGALSSFYVSHVASHCCWGCCCCSLVYPFPVIYFLLFHLYAHRIISFFYDAFIYVFCHKQSTAGQKCQINIKVRCIYGETLIKLTL